MSFEEAKKFLENLIESGKDPIDIMLILQKKVGKELAEKVLKDARDRGVF